MTSGRLAWSLLVTMTFAASFDARAQSPAGASMLEANDLFRRSMYGLARARYEDARSAGDVSPLLAYNLGITYYRIRELELAEASLESARAEPRLAALAAYNLGLTHRAAGRDDEARRWFTTAAETTDSEALAAQARRVAAELAPAPPAATADPAGGSAPTAARRETRARQPRLELRVETGYGYDDNPNRAPSVAYADRAQPGQPPVAPESAPSGYLPLKIAADYTIPHRARDTDFRIAYRLDGTYYSNVFANDESRQRLEIGSESTAYDDGRARTLRSAFYVTRRYQRDFDPDTGIDTAVLGNDTSRRFTYMGAGIEGRIGWSRSRWTLNVDGRLERRQYDEVPLVADHDQEIYFVGARLDAAVLDATTLFLGAELYRRAYDERPSRALDGRLLSTTPPLEYTYGGVEVGIRQRIGDLFTVALGYARLDRDDNHLGYHGYTLDRFRAETAFDIGSRGTISVRATQRDYEYPSAFAFNDPLAGPLATEQVSAALRARFELKDSLALTVDVIPDEVESTDPRIGHERMQASLGIVWRRR